MGILPKIANMSANLNPDPQEDRCTMLGPSEELTPEKMFGIKKNIVQRSL
jgi:hypothetical protein